jgi:hypothetical protein
MSRRGRSPRIPGSEKDVEVTLRVAERIRLSIAVHHSITALLLELEDTHMGLKKESALVTHLKILERMLRTRLDKTEEAVVKAKRIEQGY